MLDNILDPVKLRIAVSFFNTQTNPLKAKHWWECGTALLQKVNMGLSFAQHSIEERSFFLLRVRQGKPRK